VCPHCHFTAHHVVIKQSLAPSINDGRAHVCQLGTRLLPPAVPIRNGKTTSTCRDGRGLDPIARLSKSCSACMGQYARPE